MYHISIFTWDDNEVNKSQHLDADIASNSDLKIYLISQIFFSDISQNINKYIVMYYQLLLLFL